MKKEQWAMIRWVLACLILMCVCWTFIFTIPFIAMDTASLTNHSYLELEVTLYDTFSDSSFIGNHNCKFHDFNCKFYVYNCKSYIYNCKLGASPLG